MMWDYHGMMWDYHRMMRDHRKMMWGYHEMMWDYHGTFAALVDFLGNLRIGAPVRGFAWFLRGFADWCSGWRLCLDSSRICG